MPDETRRSPEPIAVRRSAPERTVPPAAGLIAIAGIALLCAAPLRGEPAPRGAGDVSSVGDEMDAPTKRWREGPVRYLLSTEENKAYRELKRATDEERRRFIEDFWARRDPDPTTPGNVVRDLFYRRVAEANRLFTDSPAPGWKTDRGKIHILLGPPDEEEWSGSRRAERHTIVWIYRSTPDLAGLGPYPTVRFVRDRAGEYRLSHDVRLFFLETSLAVAFQAQALQLRGMPASREDPGLAGVESADDHPPIVTRHDFYRTSGGSTLAVLTVGLRPDPFRSVGDPPGPPPAPPQVHRFDVSARLIEQGGTAEHPVQGEEGRLAGGGDVAPGGYRMYQGAAPVPPGPYTARYLIVDPQSGRERALEERLVVPDFDGSGPALSSVTLATRVQRIADPAREYDAPFLFGDRRVVPNPVQTFRSGDTLAVFYEVYGLEIDPIEGRPTFDVEYRFSIGAAGSRDGGDAFAPMGHPIRLTRLKTPIQDFVLALDEWSRGNYRLRVTVTDALGGGRAVREVAFRIR